MDKVGEKSQSRFFTGHYSMAEVNSICKSGMGSIRVTKNGMTRRRSRNVDHFNVHVQGNKCISAAEIFTSTY